MMRSALRPWIAGWITLTLALGIVVSPALAHHSFAMYDQTVERTMTGKLFRFVIGANHSQFVFELVDEKGDVVMENGEHVIWQVETGPAVSLARQGITVESFPIGTIFTVTLNPLRDGGRAGALRGGPIMCGKTMPEGGCNAETGKTFG